MNQFLDPKHRAEVTIGLAAVALHGLLTGGVATSADTETIVRKSFTIASEFLRQAEAFKP